jgi:hypothetical protein
MVLSWWQAEIVATLRRASWLAALKYTGNFVGKLEHKSSLRLRRSSVSPRRLLVMLQLL